MAKSSDGDRILRLLSETEGIPNHQIRAELNLKDDRYEKVRQGLLDNGLIEKYRTRGGAIRLTHKGEKAAPKQETLKSKVDKEADLYDPLVRVLEDEAQENEVDTVVWRTDKLKARGQWQNPDVTRIAIEYYQHLRKSRVIVTTYEVKQFFRWNSDAVYEAASHHRFSHEAYVVLEWPNDAPFSITDPTYKLNQIARECQRFGIGLATMEPFYTSFKLRTRLEPQPHIPDDEAVNSWLDYSFSRNQEALKEFEQRMDSIQKQLSGVSEK